MSTPIPEPARRVIQQALANGRKIEAIKLYREATGAGLAEAKLAVEAMDSGDPGLSPGTGAPPSRTQMEEVRRALFEGRRIEAVKAYRDATGKGLAEAKNEVDQMEAELRRNAPDQFQTTTSRKGCGVAAAVLAGLLAALLASLFFVRSHSAAPNPAAPQPVESTPRN